MQTFLGAIATSSSRLEPPFDTMFRNTMAEFEQKIIGEKVADLKGDLNGSVTRECLNITSNKYPFAPNSKQDVPMGEFGRLFGPNGIFDTFFREKLAGLVDTSGAAWDWKQNSKFSQALSSEVAASVPERRPHQGGILRRPGQRPQCEIRTHCPVDEPEDRIGDIRGQWHETG